MTTTTTRLQEVLSRTETLSFDCYGTLIDWEQGLKAALAALFNERLAPEGLDEAFEAYIEAEAAAESSGFRPYRDNIARAVERVARDFSISLPAGGGYRVADTLPDWLPFADTGEALLRLKGRFGLGVLSNVDRALFERTARHFPIAFDFVVTAEDVRAYKPSHLHFHHMFGAHAARESVLHVAQSLFHDGRPAEQLDLPFVWINRRGEPNVQDIPRLGEFPDLASFAEFACRREKG
jgi:2-haloalkanoic acid dehalogenase type II